MIRLRIAKVVGIVIVTMVAVFAFGRPASADEPAIVIPAGLACNFELGIDISGEQPVYREFEDKDGNLRILNAGRGVELTFTNMDTGDTFLISPTGSVSHFTIHPDEPVTLVGTGHNVIILFPSDVPGPSVVQYVGNITITIDADGIWTVQSVRGRSTDICAALTP